MRNAIGQAIDGSGCDWSSECGDAEMQASRNADKQECRGAGMQNAGMQICKKCGNAECRSAGVGSAGVQECRSAGMQECRSAGVPAD